MTRDDFAAWLGRYIEAWRTYEPDAIGDLFSEDASYAFQDGTKALHGRDAIVRDWLADRDEPGSWDAHYEPLAIDGDVHVAVGWTRYFDRDRSVRDEYTNIFLCRFDGAGRCSSFAEWWMRVKGKR